jgi:hypothetical protein
MGGDYWFNTNDNKLNYRHTGFKQHQEFGIDSDDLETLPHAIYSIPKQIEIESN